MTEKSKIRFDAFAVKMLALSLYIFGKGFIQTAYTHVSGTEFEAGPWSLFYFVGYILTFTALPMIAFLTTEASMKTGNLRQYFTRLGFAAVLTELLTDFAAYGKRAFDFKDGFFNNPAVASACNFYFTMILGSVAVCVMDRAIKRRFSPGSVPFAVLNVLTVIGCCALAVLLNSEQGAIGVLTMTAFYLLYGNPFMSLLAVVVLQVISLGRANPLFMFAPVVGTLPVVLYDGKEGHKSGLIRLITYTAYPVCYAVVLLVLRLTGGNV